MWTLNHRRQQASADQSLGAIPEIVLVPRVVDSDVGSVRNDGPQLIQPVG
ncbi:hypothetical protein IWX65_003440 [Arthrobacter sp. CAN_A214]